MKRLLVFFLMTIGLNAFEDVSFSARSLGLGGDQTAISFDLFAHTTNPASLARLHRSAIGLTASPYQSTFFTVLSYAQPVKGLGVFGGSILYHNSQGYIGSWGYGIGGSDMNLFLAVPAWKYFNFGLGFGNYSSWTVYEYEEYVPFDSRFAEGANVSAGMQASFPWGLIVGLSVNDLSLRSYQSAISHFGISWTPVFKRPRTISSLTACGEISAKISSYYGSALKVHAGLESWIFDDILGLRIGMRYGSDELGGFSPTFGISLRTHRVEKTDFELHYGLVLNYGLQNVYEILHQPLHQLSLEVFFGDARKEEKDSILAEQAERARRLREEALARERDRLRSELETIKAERSTLERERNDIERLRKERLDAVGRLKGIEITENEKAIVITLTEDALKFDSLSADIPFPAGYKVLANIASILVNYPGRKISVEVYTDNSPIPDEAKDKFKDLKALSTARAEMIRRYLVEVEGLPSANIAARGLGDAKPVADNDTPEGQAKNRRVEISIPK
jgi:flagellar motor protein MotB